MRMKACSALGALLLAACTTHADGTQSVNKTAVGAGIGAVAGGVLGNRLDRWQSGARHGHRRRRRARRPAPASAT